MLKTSPEHSEENSNIFTLEFPQAPYFDEIPEEGWNNALKEELDLALQKVGLFLTVELPKKDPTGSHELIFEGKKGVEINMEEVVRVLKSFRDTFSFVLSHDV